LDEVLSLGLGDERLEFWSSERVDETRLGDDEKQHLSASEDTEFVGLLHDTSLSLGEGDVATRLVLDELDLDLPSLAAWLVIIIVIVVGSSRDAWTLGATALGAVAGREVVLRRRVVGGGISDVSHFEIQEGIISSLDCLSVLSGCPIELEG